MPILEGGCHCGNLRVALETDLAPTDMVPRACQCSFCRMHGTAAVSDPDGALTITARDPGAMNLYRHGLGITDFVICRTCGVYIGAHMPDGEAAYANVMVAVLDDHAAFVREPVPVVRTEEDEAGKRARRRAAWTPARIVIASE